MGDVGTEENPPEQRKDSETEPISRPRGDGSPESLNEPPKRQRDVSPRTPVLGGDRHDSDARATENGRSTRVQYLDPTLVTLRNEIGLIKDV